MVCVPLPANRTTPVCTSQYAPFIHPHSDTPQFWQRSRLTRSAPVLPIRSRAAPPTSTASENCTQTESFHLELDPARRRSQTR